ncbi:MAG TPA: hypothetical protein VEC36_05960 [Patescibacteria group bacterium]|nr:hypothetical protein [Patescibacteria group bacterium]
MRYSLAGNTGGLSHRVFCMWTYVVFTMILLYLFSNTILYYLGWPNFLVIYFCKPDW